MQIILIKGQAGTGKTTRLMNRTIEAASSLITTDYQKVLAITKMHGSRRRLLTKLKDICSHIPHTVMTIDSFAVSILNRWRTATGRQMPFIPTTDATGFLDTPIGIEAGFAEIVSETNNLFKSSTIRNIIGSSYPLIIIDEFQDCHGPLLDFVVALSNCASLLLAADEFQLLDDEVQGCPAVEWVKDKEIIGKAIIEELIDFHRTSSKSILEAAYCLRNNVRSSKSTIPVVCCPNAGPAAWKIVENLVLSSPEKRWNGTSVLICPSQDKLLEKVLKSCESQLTKRAKAPILWFIEKSPKEEVERVLTSLGLRKNPCEFNEEWRAPFTGLDRLGTHIADRTRRFSKLRGFNVIPQKILLREVEKTVHDHRAYYAPSVPQTVTTVHGAKNREFDNVFILWNYKLPNSVDQQRRWLYNAVTRSKKKCMILVMGDEKRAKCDPVLSLLGPAQPVFQKKIK